MFHLPPSTPFATWLWIAALVIVLMAITVSLIRGSMQAQRIAALAKDMAHYDQATRLVLSLTCRTCRKHVPLQRVRYGQQEEFLCHSCWRKTQEMLMRSPI